MPETVLMLDALPLASLPVVGVLDQEESPSGVTYRRLPAWTRAQIVDLAQQLVLTMPAGGRLAFRTDSRVLELDVMLTAFQFADLPLRPVTFDLVVDDEVVTTLAAEDHHTLRVTGPLPEDRTLVPGAPTTLRFALPGTRERAVEVWLPHGAVLEMRGARVESGTTLEPLASERRRWVHHGSSISHCLEAERPTETWPALAARRAGVELLNLGFGGQCMLDQHVARTIRDLEAELISLKLGINVVNGDTMRERTFRPAVHGFLDTVRDGHPDTPLLVITPITCPSAEDHPGPTVPGQDGRYGVLPRSEQLSTGALTLGRIRGILTEVVTSRQQAGDDNLHLLDGRELFGTDDLALLPDGLHPDAQGYLLMGERFHAHAFAPDGPFGA
jgi:hypothetical protein